jgi:7,8-dihydropterin-6-yl-methyl-4-(beta-D-ribofuranosyl)aminobenzene 5'-phosphate synthase
MATVLVLMDNRPGTEDLLVEHGLSLYLDTPDAKWLLDCGASDKVWQNAERLGVDLRAVDAVFLSHGHSDHCGGLSAFLALNTKAQVYLSPSAVATERYSRRNGIRSISAEWDLKAYRHRIHWVEAPLVVDGQYFLFPIQSKTPPLPKANAFLCSKQAGVLVPDTFNHELGFAWKGLVFTGCAHRGVRNVLADAGACMSQPISAVIGGFHLPDGNADGAYETEGELIDLAEGLNAAYPGVHYYTGHCTGDRAFETMKSLMGDRLDCFHVGKTIHINEYV